jgi:hypothetical protein
VYLLLIYCLDPAMMAQWLSAGVKGGLPLMSLSETALLSSRFGPARTAFHNLLRRADSIRSDPRRRHDLESRRCSSGTGTAIHPLDGQTLAGNHGTDQIPDRSEVPVTPVK